MDKKKLLITLGCSYTEGMGCYLPNLLQNNKPILSPAEVYNLSKTRFHEFGWPAVLQKKIQYDCLYNLGKSSASNAYTTKRWFEVFSDVNLSKQYDVLVIWLVTHPTRMTFYRKGKLHNILPSMIETQQMYENHLQYLGDDYMKDMMLETYFNVNIIKNVCMNLNYNFLFLNIFFDEGTQLDLLMGKTHSLNTIIKNKYGNIMEGFDENNGTLSFCRHPNEVGYSIVAERLFNAISSEHLHLINTSYTPEKYISSYQGEAKQW